MVQLQIDSLCGLADCPRLCMRSEHCQAGLLRRRRLLARQGLRRFVRRALDLLDDEHPASYHRYKALMRWRRMSRLTQIACGVEVTYD